MKKGPTETKNLCGGGRVHQHVNNNKNLQHKINKTISETKF